MSDNKGKPAKRKRGKTGDISDLRRKMWRMLEKARTISETSEDEGMQLRAVSAYSTTAAIYLKALEQVDLKERVEALETEVDNVIQDRAA